MSTAAPDAANDTDIMLPAEKRVRLGSAECRRLRKEGMVPGNIYGHNETPVAIKVKVEDLAAVVRANLQVVEVDVEGEKEYAKIQQIQWDTFSQYVEHFDLKRVDKDEKVRLDIPIELLGNAPAKLDGVGVVDQLIYALPVEVPALKVPEKFELKIIELREVGDALHVSDLELPSEVTSLEPLDAVVVQINEPVVVPDPEEEGDAAIEPEVIGEGDGEADENEEG